MTDFHRRADDVGVKWALKNWQLVVFLLSLVGGAFLMHKSIDDAHSSITQLQSMATNNQDRLIRLEARVDETQKAVQEIKESIKDLTRILIGMDRSR
ncbi:MAG TPA: hypothetical protein PLP33_23745 [Leptospiraceae bacterium]|jgi:hypothetical protein|nr:hypothetical protein [Leptospiraceae bacterium]